VKIRRGRPGGRALRRAGCGARLAGDIGLAEGNARKIKERAMLAYARTVHRLDAAILSRKTDRAPSTTVAGR
jgi:hypothetical protein